MPTSDRDPATHGNEPFGEFRQEVDRLFDAVARRSPIRQLGALLGTGAGGAPLCLDVEDTGQEFVISLEVPGVKKDALDLHMEPTRVLLRGTRVERGAPEGTVYHCREIARGPFQRVVELPEPIVPDAAKAKLEEGVLTLTLPKAKPGGRKVVRVEIE